MAIKNQASKKSRRMLLRFMVVILLGWLILLGWALSLWCFLGFDKAFNLISTLSQKQTSAVGDFNDTAMAAKLRVWLGAIPSFEVTHKVGEARVFVKKELDKVLPKTTTELSEVADEVIDISKHLWLLMRLTVHVLLLKLLILLAAIPLFLLAMSTGLADGLNQRAIRTASLGRESSYVYHQLNRYLKTGLILLMALWIAMPVSITPSVVFIPVSIVLSVMVSITASRFKKHL